MPHVPYAQWAALTVPRHQRAGSFATDAVVPLWRAGQEHGIEAVLEDIPHKLHSHSLSMQPSSQHPLTPQNASTLLLPCTCTSTGKLTEC